jgi:CcmD family protein
MLCCAGVSAQATPEMADAMRGDGKIYVVIGVIAVIFVAIVVFIANVDRKVSRLEKKLKEKEIG